MPSKTVPSQDRREALLPLAALYLMTLVHHLYGGIAFASPERLYMAGAFTLIFGLTFWLYRMRHRLFGRVGFQAVAWLFWVGMLGGYEGGYNHAYSSLVVLSGGTVANHPPDLFFQATGILTAIMALLLLRALVRAGRL